MARNFYNLHICWVFLFLLSKTIDGRRLKPSISFEPEEVSIVKGHTEVVKLVYKHPLPDLLHLNFHSLSDVIISPDEVLFSRNNTEVTINVTGLAVTSLTYIDINQCEFIHDPERPCPFNVTDVYVSVEVTHSHYLTILIISTGWIYTFAWSFSFYPQIILTFRLKSAEGMNFDFLILNVLGHFGYTIYNSLMYFNDDIQDLYLELHPRKLNPVLFNDVLFASHSLFASTFTLIQCLCFELIRRNRKSKVSPETPSEKKKDLDDDPQENRPLFSYTCIALSTILTLFAFVSLFLALIGIIDWLMVINNLSLIKTIVTLCKYIPQVIMNYRRKSTSGWSIARIFWDFTGGSMSITQMILQACNTDDWSGFIGNPWKLGIGLFSIIFDIIFMVQHFILYRHPKKEEIEMK